MNGKENARFQPFTEFVADKTEQLNFQKLLQSVGCIISNNRRTKKNNLRRSHKKKLCRTFDFCFNNKLTSLFTPFSAIAVFPLSLKVKSKHLRKQKLSYGRFYKTEIRCLQCIAGRKRKPGSQSLLRVHSLSRDKSRDVHSKAKKSN